MARVCYFSQMILPGRTKVILPVGNWLPVLQYIVFGAALLYFGRALFIPLSFALLISFVLYPVCFWMEQKGIKRLAATLISVFGLMLLFSGVFILLVQQFISFLEEWPVIKLKFEESIAQVSQFFSEYYSVSKQQQHDWLTSIANQSAGSILQLIRQTIAAYSVSVVLLILVPVFASLILYYRSLLLSVLFRVFPNERQAEIKSMLLQAVTTYYNFIKGMIIVYMVVGILNSIGLLLLGVPHAIFFGFVAAVLTFIPYIGIMVGSLLPITMAWITYNSVWYALGVVGVFTVVQYLEANVIFPLAVSNRLKMNALVTLAAILAGGILWGVAGLILFVPYLAILKLIADRHPKMKTWSLLIGTD